MKSMKLVAIVLTLAACTKADPESSAAPTPTPAPKPAVAFAEPPPAPTPPVPTPTPAPPPPQAPLEVKVELTAVTLNDDCVPAGASAKGKSATMKADSADFAESRVNKRCGKASMQLAVSASATAKVEIKSVELFDETGKSLGKLQAKSPRRWSGSRYEAWDEILAANSPVKISYALQQPNLSGLEHRFSRTYTLKTVVTVGGIDKAVKKSITLSTPATLPANVKT